MNSTIAMKARRDILPDRLSSGGRLLDDAAGIFAIPVDSYGHQNNERNDTPKQAMVLSPATEFVWLAAAHGRATGAENVLCLFLSILADFHLKRETLTESRSLAVPRKGGDVDEYLTTTVSGRDESEAPVIIPLC